MRVLVDLDGVIHNFISAFSTVTGKTFYPRDWYFYRKYYTDYQFAKKLNDEPRVFMGPEYPGAVFLVHAIKRAGHEVVIVTDRPSHMFEVTRDWLIDKGLGDIPIKLSPDKTCIEADWAIDDRPENVRAMMNSPKHTTAYLLKRPWNAYTRGHGSNPDLNKVNSLDEFVRMLV